MCDTRRSNDNNAQPGKTIPVAEAVGMVLAHDVTEIRKDDFKGRAFRKGHVVRPEDIHHLRRLGKEHLFVLSIGADEVHENDAAAALAAALMGEGVEIEGEPREGKINIIAARDGLLKINKEALLAFNMLGDVMCATRHGNTLVKKGRVLAGTRAIPLVVKRSVVEEAVRIAESSKTKIPPRPPLSKGGWGGFMERADHVGVKKREHSSLGPYDGNTVASVQRGIIEVKELRKPRAGIVITGNEVYNGRVQDAFAPIITKKIEDLHVEIVGIYYAPDDEKFIEERLRELLNAGADLLITTGGMSVDPDDVTRFAIRNLGATDITYGSAALPGAMVLVGYIDIAECGLSNADSNPPSPPFGKGGQGEIHPSSLVPRPSSVVPILGIPACGMYHKITVFDLIIPRVLAGDTIGRKELAELGHGGLCLNCRQCRYPVCPFGK
jgi:hypothetical protein